MRPLPGVAACTRHRKSWRSSSSVGTHEAGDPRALRVEGGHDLADQTVLAATVERLEHDEQRLAGLGPQPLLELGELVAQLVDASLRRRLVALEPGRAARVDCGEVGPRAGRDAEQVAEAHNGLRAVRYWAPNGRRKDPSAPRGLAAIRSRAKASTRSGGQSVREAGDAKPRPERVLVVERGCRSSGRRPSRRPPSRRRAPSRRARPCRDSRRASTRCRSGRRPPRGRRWARRCPDPARRARSGRPAPSPAATRRARRPGRRRTGGRGRRGGRRSTRRRAGCALKSASMNSASGTSRRAISSIPSAPSRPMTRRPSPRARRAPVPVPVPTSRTVSPGRRSARRTTSAATGTRAGAIVAA